jgi:hypothetical protein
MLNSSKSTIPSMEQRKSQINLLNFMALERQQQQRRDSKEFLFPDDNLLHKRRPSAADHSATQSEDDESSGSFEVNDERTCVQSSPEPKHVRN